MADVKQLLNSTQNKDIDKQGEVTHAMYELIDDVILGLAFEVHRAAKIGTLFIDETDTESEKQYQIVNERGLDIFGQVPTKKQYECVCPNCGRNMAAARFAPHLEKCMGMGRNSSRIASRRIASAHATKDGDESDEASKDDDWASEKKVKKLKLGKSNGMSKVKTGNKPKHGRNGDSAQHGAAHEQGLHPQFDSMTLEEKKALLMSSCGVISEHTGKMCTKSIRCPQHSSEQKRLVRAHLSQTSRLLESDDVDIDTYNEDDSQSLRDTLQWEAISNPSPADSCSTTGSTSKKRKTMTRHGKKNKSSKSSTRSDTPTSSQDVM